MSTKSDSGQKNTPDVLFYHLERSSLMQVLPSLLEKSLERGWAVVIEGPTRKQIDNLNNELWISRDDSFLPHGTSDDHFSSEQPIFLTEKNDNPNQAAIRFFVEGAQPGDLAGYTRIVYLFDGHNNVHVENARKQWKRLADEGANATYWAQNDGGGWEKKA